MTNTTTSKSYNKGVASPKTNRQIRSSRLRVIDAQGENLGVMSTREALGLAEKAGLDLVEVSPTAQPPVAKIMDFGKYKYELSRKAHKPKKPQSKEMRLSTRIGEHDYQVKLKQLRKFLTAGSTVQVSVSLKGREKAHPEMAEAVLNKLIEDVRDLIQPVGVPKRAGRGFVIQLKPHAMSS